MVSKQSVGAEATSNKPRPKNQDWMNEFSAETSPEETSLSQNGDNSITNNNFNFPLTDDL